MQSRIYVTVRCPSVCLSVCMFACPIDRPQPRRAASLLLGTKRAGDIDRQRRAPGAQQQHGAAAANADIVTCTAAPEKAEHRLVFFAVRRRCRNWSSRSAARAATWSCGSRSCRSCARSPASDDRTPTRADDDRTPTTACDRTPTRTASCRCSRSASSHTTARSSIYRGSCSCRHWPVPSRTVSRKTWRSLHVRQFGVISEMAR